MSDGVGHQHGLVLHCDVAGRIVQVIRDDFGLCEGHSEHLTVRDLLFSEEGDVAGTFLNEVSAQGTVLDRTLVVALGRDGVPLHFAGFSVANGVVLVAARTCPDLAHFNEELMRINNEQNNTLRAALKDLSLLQKERAAQDSHLYDDLSRLNNELANLQRELVKKNVDLEKLIQQKNRFLGMTVHDLRSPLAVILSYSKFLETEAADVLSEEHREFVSIIRETSEFMLGVIHDLLEVTALESGQLRLNLQEVDLGDLVEHNVVRNRVLAAKKDVKIESRISPGLPLLWADPGKLEQVLNNLIGNAVKFSFPHSTVEVLLESDDAGVRVSVVDHGVGISETDRVNLFKPYGTGSVRGTGGERSTGLGLWIVNQIVEGHGGQIQVSSARGQGSTFCFILPIKGPSVSDSDA